LIAQNEAVINNSQQTIELNRGPGEAKLLIHVPAPVKATRRAFEAMVQEVHNILVACEFLDVFRDDLPGLPPERDIEFVIELKPGTTPISRRSYCMHPNELAELKTQLQDLLEKGFIRLSSSPWCCPTIFVKKHDQTLRMCVWTIDPLMKSQSRTSTPFLGLIFCSINFLEPWYSLKLTLGRAIIKLT
jgi:hypothetical protein